MANRLVEAACASALVLTACSPENSEPPTTVEIGEVTSLKVVCANPKGLPDKYTDDLCAETAQQVKAGLALFNDITRNRVTLPQDNVTYEVQDVPVKVNAADRCADLGQLDESSYKREQKKWGTILSTITDGVLKQNTDIDFSSTALYVAANAPIASCPNYSAPTNSVFTNERCHEATGAAQIPTSQALGYYDYSRVVFGFYSNGPHKSEEVAHEFLHLGRRHPEAHLGHEMSVCSKTGDTVPSVIHTNEQGLGTDILSYKGSIMSYNDGHYLASPHELYFGFISDDRIARPTKDTSITLHETDAKGIALMQLSITNSAVRELIAATAGEEYVDHYKLMIGKPEGQGVSVYAAMSSEEQAKVGGLAPIVRIATLGSEASLTLEGDGIITVGRITTDAADVKLQLQ